jgi:hypothetical protein
VHLAIGPSRGFADEHGGRETVQQLVDEDGLGSVKEEESGDPAGGQVPEKRRGLQVRSPRRPG